MALSMRAHGSKTKLKAKAFFGMPKVTFTKETSEMTKPMATEFTPMSMEADMKASGETICRKAMGLKCGLTGLNKWETTKKAKNMDMGLTTG